MSSGGGSGGLASFSVALTRRRPLTPVRTPSHDEDDGSSSPVDRSKHKLKRTLNAVDLTLYGIGCSVGAGIYSLVGIGADLAGPAISLSFFVCGVACVFTSLCYAEFSARVPLAGSAYVFAYVSFGELVGWLVGWNLTLGYGVSAAVVARSWAEYVAGFVSSFLGDGGDSSTSWLTHAPVPWVGFGEGYTCSPLSVVIVGICTAVLVTGAKESTRFNNMVTALNLSVLGLVVLAGVGSGTIEGDNLVPFLPRGFSGMARGTGLVFFSYLGFDMVSCLSEEVKDPERNMPVGIIGSLLVSMSIYVVVSIVVVGLAPVALLGEDVPIVNALLANACCSHADQLGLTNPSNECLSYSCSPVLHGFLMTASRIVSFGAIFGLTAATFACLMGQPRIFYSMSKDGLLFPIYSRVNNKTGVPTAGTILTGVLTALVACFVDLEALANAISLGTLQVFTFVNAGVIILRMRPEQPPTAPCAVGTAANAGDRKESRPLTPRASPPQFLRSASSGHEAASRASAGNRTSFHRDRLPRGPLDTGDGRMSVVADNGLRPVAYTLLFTMCATLASMCFTNGWRRGVTTLSIAAAFVSAVLLWRLPRSPPPVTFACPAVPTVPLLGIACNSYMMGSLPVATWSAVLGWLACGALFYFCYGIHHSELRHLDDGVVATDGVGFGVKDAAAVDGVVEVSTPLLSEATEEDGYDSIYDE